MPAANVPRTRLDRLVHKALKSEQQSLRALGISIEPMTPAEAILIDTQRLLTRNALPKRVDAVGKVVPLVCQTGTIRFVQLRTQRQESSMEPVVGAVLKETTFRFWSPLQKARTIGVRRTMSIQPSTSVQPL